jgi:hypothetical protein
MLFVSPELVAQTSYVAPTAILSKKGYQLGISGDYFKSSTRYDNEGEEVKFEDGEAFSRSEAEVRGLYGLTENLQIGGGVRMRQNNSTFIDATSNEEESKTSTGVESTFASFTYGFKPVDRLQYVIEGSFRFRPFANDETDDSEGNPILGDDGNEYSFGLGVTYASKTNNFLSMRGGYRSPGTDLSTEIYWQAEGALAWRYLALVAGVNGITSLKNSPFEDDPSDQPAFNTGSTALYNSINREMIAPYAGVNIALGSDWRVELRGSQVVSGRSTDLGTAFGVSLIRRVENKKGARPDKVFKDYDFEAAITKVSPKKGFVVIDRGVSEDIQKGMKIDFYEFDYVGGNILLARGTVIQAKADTSIVKITHLYNTKKELKEGVVARGSFR